MSRWLAVPFIGLLMCGLSGSAARAAASYNLDAVDAEATEADGDQATAAADGNSCLTGNCNGCRSMCDCVCDDSDCCCDCFNGRRRILGFLPSDHCFDRFISPISNPFYFEDARSLTEVRGIFIDNTLPRPQTQGGDVQVWAGQVRGRITNRFSLIAPRLGDMQINNVGNGHPHGFMSAPLGGKYNLIRDVDNQFLVSVGATYFIPGFRNVFQGFGSGDFHFFLTGGKQIFGRGHWLSGTGFRIPTDANWGTQMWYWSNQWDYELPGHIYPLMGVNWYHWMKSAGLNATNGLTGLDLVNLPTAGVAGANVATYVIGARWKPSKHFELGSGWEVPMTQRTDIMQNRVYADMIFRY
jgi:hypothetical protein